jgi:hypothetical protein
MLAVSILAALATCCAEAKPVKKAPVAAVVKLDPCLQAAQDKQEGCMKGCTMLGDDPVAQKHCYNACSAHLGIDRSKCKK